MLQFIPEPINFAEVTRLPIDVKKAWLKVTLKDIINLINNQTFIMDDQKEGRSSETMHLYLQGKYTI